MSQFYIGDYVEVVTTSEKGVVTDVIKKWFGEDRYIVNGKKYKESELRRASEDVSVSSTTDTSPDTVTQVVLANMYMNQLDEIVQDVSDTASTIPEPEVKVADPEPSESKTWYTPKEDFWSAPVSTESVNSDSTPSHSVNVDNDYSSSRSSSVDDTPSYSSRDDGTSWGSNDSSSYDSSSSYSSSPSGD